ncbi:XRE family transcriptional regulator [Streptomyces sp. NTH33]|uniref:helix-turn-helix domain-containing protein n=1 Tax=Streptomyces sp. NTH33 TaxID=1735453 RepID=UPI000DA7A6EE|nr:helix-turn-helix transcriptional regulator [Streptomyces sp. NTH33]PZH18743.1 XRE family transcriptional regulator [Streptomyces sp. NTH33]
MLDDPHTDAWLRQRRQEIGGRIQDARQGAGLTQDEVVRRTGLARSTVQRIERGDDGYSVDPLLRIARAIGVPLADLVREGDRLEE